jgi:hypothetical protein
MHSTNPTVNLIIDYLQIPHDPDFICSRLIKFLSEKQGQIGLDLCLQLDNCCEFFFFFFFLSFFFSFFSFFLSFFLFFFKNLIQLLTDCVC